MELEQAAQEPARVGGGGLSEGPAAAGPGKGTLTEANKDDGSPLVVERVGMTPDEDPVPGGDAGLNRPESNKQELADIGKTIPQQGGAEELAGKGGGGAGGGGEAMPTSGPGAAITASIGEAQAETREAVAQSQAESDAYKAEMKQKRDQFEDEQHATMLEQLKTSSPADKRATLKDLGYSDKEIKKMKDAEVDRIIEGKLESEQRKTKIMGMDPDELKALTPAQKIQYLVDLGIDKEDLDHIGQQRAVQAFDDIMRVAHVPGQHKVQIKVKGGFLGLTGKSWDVTIKCDADGNTDIQAEKKGGFLSKLWGWIKAALPIILVVLAPLTAGATLIALAVWQAVEAIKNGDWLGAIVAVAGAMVGVSAFMAAKGLAGAAQTFGKIADVAKKARDVAQAAKMSLDAAKAKNAGSLLGALASGASAFAGFASKSAENFANTMTKWSERLKKWSAVVTGGESVVKSIKSGDPIAAVGGAFDTALAVVTPEGKKDGKPETGVQKNLGRASAITGFIGAGKAALANQPPDYGAVAEAALGIAGTLKENNNGIQSAQKITAAANKLKAAWANKGSDPGALTDAAFALAEAIHTAKYEGDGDGKAGDEEDTPSKKFERATRVVHAAAAALGAATQKPRPNYSAAAEAVTELTAALTANKKAESAALLTSKFNAWTRAVNSKDERAILAAGKAFGEAIDGMRKEIVAARTDAKKAAEKEGTPLPDDNVELPPGPDVTDGLDALPGTEVTLTPPDGAQEPLPSRPLPRIDLRPTPGLPTSKPKPAKPGHEGSETEGNESEGSEGDAKEGAGEKGKEKENEKEKEQEKENPNVERVMAIIKVFAEMRELYHDGLPKATLEAWESAVDTYEAFKGDKESSKYRQAYTTLAALGDMREFVKEAVKGFFEFREEFGDPFNTARVRAALGRYRKYTSGLGRLVRLGSIPGNILSAADNLVIVCGYDKSLSGAKAKTTDRIKAATDLISDLEDVPEDLTWAIRAGRIVLEKLGAEVAASAAVGILKSAASKISGEVESVAMKYLAPVLEKVAATESGAAAEAMARKFAGSLASWGAKLLASGGSSTFQKLAALLGSELGVTIRTLASPEVQIAIEVGKLEAEFAAELYKEAYHGISHFLSARVFGGQTIDQLKNEIEHKKADNSQQADQFFYWVLFTFLKSADSQTRSGWAAYATRELPRRVGAPSFMDAFPSRPYEALTALEPDLKTLLAAPALKDLATTYLDSEYKRVFHEDP